MNVCAVAAYYISRFKAHHCILRSVALFRCAEVNILAERNISAPVIDNAEAYADYLYICADKLVRYRRFNACKLLAADKRDAVGDADACKYVSVEVMVRNVYRYAALNKSVNDAYVSVQIKLPRFNPLGVDSCIKIKQLIGKFQLHVTSERHSFKTYARIEITDKRFNRLKPCEKKNRYRGKRIKLSADGIGKLVDSAAETRHVKHGRRQRNFQPLADIKFNLVGKNFILALYLNLFERERSLTFDNLDVHADVKLINIFDCVNRHACIYSGRI